VAGAVKAQHDMDGVKRSQLEDMVSVAKYRLRVQKVAALRGSASGHPDKQLDSVGTGRGRALHVFDQRDDPRNFNTELAAATFGVQAGGHFDVRVQQQPET
jgi:hypothetical protein